MTGHQPHPDSVGAVHPIPIENMVLACGVKPENMKIIDQGQSEEFIAAVREFVDKPEVSVIIARRERLGKKESKILKPGQIGLH